MSEALYLNLKDDQLVLFADIIGFSNAVRENEHVTLEDKGRLIVNFPVDYDNSNEKYSPERQKEMGIKFLWVSDSIIITTPKENANRLFAVLVDITHTLYGTGFSLRGAITIGKIYHENNIWGPAYIEAVKTEGNIAVYPRVVLNEKVFHSLDIDPTYKDFIQPSETPEYMQFDYFDCYISQLVHDGNNVITSILSIYVNFIRQSYEKAKLPDHLEKYVWLAEKLIAAIKKHSEHIDSHVAENEKWSTISGKAVRVTSHKQYLEQLEPIKLDKVRR